MNIKRINIIAILIVQSLLFAKITKGPYLQKPENYSITIMWESDVNVASKVIYWQSGDKKSEKSVSPLDSNNNLFLYSIKIEGLKTNQKYFYKVISGSDTGESYFYTNPSPGVSFSFVAIGDSRSNHKVFSAIANDIDKINPRLVINMGDLVHKGKNFDEWDSHFFIPAKSLINHIPHISTLGDHETADKYNGYSFYYYFRNGINTEKQWFSYDFGDIHFISLDYRGENNPEMIKWFKNDVKQSDAKWKIVYLHRPSYNLGGHRANWGKQLWTKLYSENKIDIVFAGHSHVYERFYPMRPSGNKNAWPVTYITTGGAGAGLYDAVQNEFTAVSKSVNHYNIITVSDDTLKLKSLQLNGTILDKFEIVKKNGKYSDSYLALVKPQEVMDIYMKFVSRLHIKFNTLPTKEVPCKKSISFDGKGLKSNIPFEIKLSEKSENYYRIEPIEGVLKQGEKFKSKIVLYAKSVIKQKGRFFDPPLFINVIFKYKGKSYSVYGAENGSTFSYK